jgi:hypothetical protein
MSVFEVLRAIHEFRGARPEARVPDRLVAPLWTALEGLTAHRVRSRFATVLIREEDRGDCVAEVCAKLARQPELVLDSVRARLTSSRHARRRRPPRDGLPLGLPRERLAEPRAQAP